MEFEDTPLYERAKIYNSKRLLNLEIAVESKKREELSELRPIPAINTHSKTIVGQRDPYDLPRS